MNIVNTKCSSCGATLKIDEYSTQIVCEHCGANLLIEKNEQLDSENQVVTIQMSKNIIKNRPTAYIVKIAMLGALAFTLTLLRFPIFPSYAFLEMDFSSVITLIGGFVLGPIAAVIIEAVKIGLMIIQKGPSFGGVGDLSNFICAVSFVLPCAILYKYRKGIKWVIVGLSSSIIIEVIISLLSNYFIIVPLFTGGVGMPSVYYGFVVAFNLIKYTSCATITFFVYKRISRFLHRL